MLFTEDFSMRHYVGFSQIGSHIVKSRSEKLDKFTGSPPPANASKKDTIQPHSISESNTDIAMNIPMMILLLLSHH